MLTKNPPEGERKLSDQALLPRSNDASADFRALSDRDYAKDVVVIERLRKGMVMSHMQAAVWENVVFSHAAALSRWEGEGGSPCGGDQAVTPEKRGI